MSAMGVLSRFGKQNGRKPVTAIGEGKYCVYHHGLVVMRHSCGAALCRECLSEWRNCPLCHQPIEQKGTRETIREGRKGGSEEAGPASEEKIKRTRTTRLEEIPDEGGAIEAVPARPRKRAIRRTESVEKGREGEEDDGEGETEDERIDRAEEKEEEGEGVEGATREMAEKSEVEATPAEMKRIGEVPPVVDGEVEEEIGEEEARDDSQKSKRARRPRPKPLYVEKGERQPMYKRRKHAEVSEDESKEGEEEAEKKKKVRVRTVPPVGGRSRGFENL